MVKIHVYEFAIEQKISFFSIWNESSEFCSMMSCGMFSSVTYTHIGTKHSKKEHLVKTFHFTLLKVSCIIK